MSEEMAISGQKLAEIASFVASSVFETTVVSKENASSSAKGGQGGGRVGLAMTGEPSWLLVAKWPASSTPFVAQFTGNKGRASAEQAAAEVMGELVNIVAGQLKSEYNLPHRLGLPSASAAGEDDSNQQEGHLSAELQVAASKETFRVDLYRAAQSRA